MEEAEASILEETGSKTLGLSSGSSSEESEKSVNSENALQSCVETVVVPPSDGVVTTFNCLGDASKIKKGPSQGLSIFRTFWLGKRFL